jgi:hypothetical protein
MIISDNFAKGLIYNGDYTGNFTTHSLVTKGYVDSVAGGLQGAYDNSTVNPEILTNATLGPVNLRRGSATDTDDVLTVQKGDGADTIKLRADGYLTTETLQVNGQMWSDHYVGGTSLSSTTIDFDNSNVQSYTLGATTTFNFTNLKAGGDYTVIVRQATVGGPYTCSFTSAKWPNNVAPIQTGTASTYDVYKFVYDGTNIFGRFDQNYS